MRRPTAAWVTASWAPAERRRAPRVQVGLGPRRALSVQLQQRVAQAPLSALQLPGPPSSNMPAVLECVCQSNLAKRLVFRLVVVRVVLGSFAVVLLHPGLAQHCTLQAAAVTQPVAGAAAAAESALARVCVWAGSGVPAESATASNPSAGARAPRARLPMHGAVWAPAATWRPAWPAAVLQASHRCLARAFGRQGSFGAHAAASFKPSILPGGPVCEPCGVVRLLWQCPSAGQ